MGSEMCIRDRGRIFDAVLDIRPDSATFGQTYVTELSDMNGRLLWVPPGFAHGFTVLSNDSADLLYKVDAPYNPEGEGGIRWNDPDVGIEWPVSDPIVSSRDLEMPTFESYRQSPVTFQAARPPDLRDACRLPGDPVRLEKREEGAAKRAVSGAATPSRQTDRQATYW